MNPDYDKIGHDVIGASFDVRKKLGRFLLEGIYQQALGIELRKRGHHVILEYPVQILYEGELLPRDAYRVDLVVDNCVFVELKALAYMTNTEMRQLNSYMKLKDIRLGYVINFGTDNFATGRLSRETQPYYNGIYRIVNKFEYVPTPEENNISIPNI